MITINDIKVCIPDESVNNNYVTDMLIGLKKDLPDFVKPTIVASSDDDNGHGIGTILAIRLIDISEIGENEEDGLYMDIMKDKTGAVIREPILDIQLLYLYQ